MLRIMIGHSTTDPGATTAQETFCERIFLAIKPKCRFDSVCVCTCICVAGFHNK